MNMVKKFIIMVLAFAMLSSIGCSKKKENNAFEELQKYEETFFESFKLNAAYYGVGLYDMYVDHNNLYIIFDNYNGKGFDDPENNWEGLDHLGSLICIYRDAGIIKDNTFGSYDSVVFEYTKKDDHSSNGLRTGQRIYMYYRENGKLSLGYGNSQYDYNEYEFNFLEPIYTFDSSKDSLNEMENSIEALLNAGYAIEKFGSIYQKESSEESESTVNYHTRTDYSSLLEDYPDIYDYSNWEEFYEDHNELTEDEAYDLFEAANNE